MDWHRSLWEQVCSWLKPQEVEEVRVIIGVSQIRKNELLLGEINALSSMLDDFRTANQNLARDSGRTVAQRDNLLCGGADRDLLEGRIRLLLSQVQNKTESLKNDGVYQYMVSDKQDTLGVSKSAPASSRSSARSSGSSSRPSSAMESLRRTSSRSAPVAKSLSRLRSSVNAIDIDAVARDVRKLFAEEEKKLLEEVDCLMAMLEDEDHDRCQLASQAKKEATTIPTSTELRKFSSKLEQEWLRSDVTTTLLKTPLIPRGVGPDLIRARRDRPKVSKGPKPPPLKLPIRRPDDDDAFLCKPEPRKSLSTRIRSTVAEAKETGRDDIHLSDERFLV